VDLFRRADLEPSHHGEPRRITARQLEGGPVVGTNVPARRGERHDDDPVDAGDRHLMQQVIRIETGDMHPARRVRRVDLRVADEQAPPAARIAAWHLTAPSARLL
jgi:hypothetical protein